jgi:hypothetical protein
MGGHVETPHASSGAAPTKIDPGPLTMDFNFEDLDQLGPLIKSLIRNKKETAYMEQLDLFVQKQEAEIERLCNYHYQEFIQSVDQLLHVRAETVQLKGQVASLSHEFQRVVKSSADKKRDLIQRRQYLCNVENALEAMNQCLEALDLTLRANKLFEARKFYSSLRSIDSVKSKVASIQDFEFSQTLRKYTMPFLTLLFRLNV